MASGNEHPSIVRRDQCNGVTLACVNCQVPLGKEHDVMCYATAIARQEARWQPTDIEGFSSTEVLALLNGTCSPELAQRFIDEWEVSRG